MTQSQYKDLNDFLAKHNAKNDKNGGFTHTRIGDKELNIFPGSYSIPKEELQTFYHLYYDYVFIKKKKEYLTEKQLENAPCMAVDFDFRYAYDIEERIHTKEHIQDMVVVYLEEIKQYFVFEENKPFDIFIFEKPHVNRVEDKNITKDGIHMLICLQVDHVFQTMIREKMIEKLGEIWDDLPLTNSWDSVLDEGISKGKTNWQLFGSRKPGNENYELVRHFSITFDSADGEFMMDEKNIRDFDLKNNFYKLSVQNINNPTFEINPKIKKECEKRMEKNGQNKKKTTKTKINLLVEEEDVNDINDVSNESISLSEIINKEMLQKGLEYQDFVTDVLINELGIALSSYGSTKYQYTKGENKQGFEIKFDDKYKDTGNIYIEIAEKSNAVNLNFVNSGIFRNDNTWLYLIGNYNEIFIFSKKHLILMYKSKKYKEVETATSKGILIDKIEAEKYCIKKLLL
jgi:hypothetical protein